MVSSENTSGLTMDISENLLAALFDRWSYFKSHMFLERTCLEETQPPRWVARATTDIRLGEVTAAILDHLQWDDVVILTDGASDGELPLALACTYSA